MDYAVDPAVSDLAHYLCQSVRATITKTGEQFNNKVFEKRGRVLENAFENLSLEVCLEV